MVIRRLSSVSWSSSRQGPPRSVSLLRRFGPRLGRCSRRPPLLRLVVSSMLVLFDQPVRAVGNSLRGSGFSSSPPGSLSCLVFRQLHCSGLPSEARWDSFFLAERGHSGTPSPLRVSVCSSPSPVHSRSSECSGGFPQLLLSSPRLRMAVVSSGCGGAPPSVASHHRPLRDLSEPSPAGVFLSHVRPAVCRHGCDVAVMGRPPGLRLPSLRPSSSGVGEGSGVQEAGNDVGGSVLASAPLVPGPSGAASGDPPLPATKEGSSQTATFPPESVCALADCLSYLRRSARQAGFSDALASQLAHFRCRATRVNYQTKWVVYRSWCHRHGHSVSRPVAKVADFLLYLRRSLSYSSIASYRSMLSGVSRFVLLVLSSHFVLHDLLRSFCMERPLSSSRVPPCDFLMVLRFLRALCLSLWLLPHSGPSPRRSFFWSLWLQLLVLVSSRLFRAKAPFLARMLTFLISRSFAQRRNLLSVLCLVLFVSGHWRFSLVTFQTSFFFVLFGPCVFILLVLPLSLRVLALCLSLVLLLSLRPLLASSFAMSFLVLTRPPPLLLLLPLLVLPLLLLRHPRCELIVCVGLRLRGLLRVMPPFPRFWLRRLGLLLQSSPPFIFLMFSSLLMVLGWVLWWRLVL